MPTPSLTQQYLDLTADAGLLCTHCHRRKDEHYPVRLAVDVPAGPALICPTSLFYHPPARSRAAAAAMRAEDSR